jgi:hypothetical protein
LLTERSGAPSFKALAAHEQPMQVAEVHCTVEQALGPPVPKNSI